MLKKSLPIVFVSFLLLGTFISAIAQNAMPKKYQSLLWEISGNGLKKPSYLYGTMHVSDKLVFNLPDSFFIGIKSVQTVALELNMNTWIDDIILIETAETNKNNATYANKSNLFYSKAFNIDAPEENEIKYFLQFRPNVTDRLLYRNNRQNSDYQEDTYLDAFIFQAGTKLNKNVVGLENYKQSEELSIKADKTDRELRELDKNREEVNEEKSLRLKDISGGKSLDELREDSYRKGDLDLLDSINKLTSDAGFLNYMLYERNDIMAKRMDSIMRKSSLFTGVGAAHLPGDLGVIELLRKMGYKLRPITNSKADIKSKTLIDETRFPTQMKTQFAPDSIFSVAVPGKLYEIPAYGSFKYYLFNDMSNGSYYCIQRMNHYGKLLDQNQDYILKRIDSLIFENIPGKLISKKESITALGYPKIEIINKTAKGDYQKQQIIITPTEIYSFKMSGNQEYVIKGKEADLFFNSISFYELNKPNMEYKSKFGYSVSLPANKTISTVNASNYNPMQNEIVNAHNKDNYSLVMAASLYDFEYIEEDTFELNMLAERFALQTNQIINSRYFFSQNGNPAIGFTLENKTKTNNKYSAQIIIAGADYFLLCTNTDSTSALPFFKSFKTYPKTYQYPFSKVADTSLHFTVKTQEFRNIYSDLVVDNADNYNRYSMSKEEKDKRVYFPSKDAKVYVSHETKEKIYVEFRKFSMYYQEESMDEFWRLRIKGLSDDFSMKVSRVSSAKKGQFYEHSLLVSDTGSAKGIFIKSLQRCGGLFTLKTVIDTTKELSDFVKTFYDSFLPDDTCIGIDLTSDKLDNYFFNKIYSTDTAENKKALGAIEYVHDNMMPSNIPSLIKAINNNGFNALSTINKKTLIYCFDGVKSKESIPFLTSLYQQYSDSVEIELSILNTLARYKNEESVKVFLKLLKIDVPITTNENSIAFIFNLFGDSLENAQLLFPELIKYTKYPEYRTGIYSLLAEINDAKILKPKAYKSLLDDILLDANYELKKYISDKDRDKEPYRYGNNYKTDRIFDELNTRQQKIYNYTSLFAPLYDNSDIKKFYAKLLKTTTSDLFKAVIYGQLIINNMVVHDTIIKQLANSTASRLVFYRILNANNKIQLFDKDYLNQKDLVIASLYGSNENFKKDTVVLISVNKVDYNNKPGNLYVFKTRPKDKKIWKLGYSAVHPLDNTLVNFKPQFTKTYFSFDSDAQLQKELTKLMRQIRIKERNRANIMDFQKEEEEEDDYYY